MFCSNFHIGKAHLVPFGHTFGLYKEFSFDYALLVVTYGKMSLNTFHICVASSFHEQRLCAGLIYLLGHNCNHTNRNGMAFFAHELTECED